MDSIYAQRVALFKKVLSNRYVDVKIDRLSIEETPGEGNTVASFGLSSGENVKSSGVGVVDALFNGLKDHYKGSFPSIESITLTKFFVKLKSTGTKSLIEVEIEIANSYGNLFSFKDSSPSLLGSCAVVSANVAEFFVNSEFSCIEIYKSLHDAKSRARIDLATRYESELAEIVKSTSYTEVIEKVRKEIF